MAKGIRVNQLAKELGVTSKVILDKCRAEGLGETAKNHQSNVPLGLAATIREWFSDGGGGTAVEVAAPVETAVLQKVRTRKVRPSIPVGGDADGSDADDLLATGDADVLPANDTAVAEVFDAPTGSPEATSVAHAVPGETTSSVEPDASAAYDPSFADDATAEDQTLASDVQTSADAASNPDVAYPPAVPASPSPVPAFSPSPVPASPVIRPAASRTTPGGEGGRSVLPPPPETRPTVTLEQRGQVVQRPVRPSVTPAPQLRELQKATIQGPKLIRQEKPDVVAAPRPRTRPGGPGGPGAESPTFTRAMPRAGSGVRVTIEEDAEAKKKAAAGRSLSARRRGPDGRRGEAEEKLREFTEADIIARRDALNDAAASRARFDHHLRKTESRGQGFRAVPGARRGTAIAVEEPITVRTLSAALGVKANELIGRLIRQKIFATVNQALDIETAQMLAIDFGVELEVAEARSLEDQLSDEFEVFESDEGNLTPRPPVVTILGHVDHGKTSLLDKIRAANVAAGESGGITQHIAAFNVGLERGGQRRTVTFIDTPGHQAFTAMRARGANMTDIVVLVVSAAEGVQPQTVESINHAKAAGVPIVVALNKIDRPDANPDRVLGQLSANDLNPIEYGGQTEVVRTSALQGTGIDSLLEILDLQAEIMELKADPSAPASGVVVEARVDPGLGPVCTVLVQQGTLKVGDVLLAGSGYGRIRALRDSDGRQVREAGPSTPVLVSGLSELPAAGDKFFQLDDFDRARSIAEERRDRVRSTELAKYQKVTLDSLFDTIEEGEIRTINLILKGDVAGSVETLAKTVTDQNTSEVRVKVIHSAVGAISESDVELADASEAVVIGFHVAIDEKARAIAEQRGVEIRLYQVIYEIFDDLKKALSGMLEPEVREKYHGTLEVRQVFKVSRLGNVAGCFVTDGHVQRGSRIRLIRDGVVVTQDVTIESLKRVKDDVREVKQGFECGIKLSGYDDIKEGDKLEAYVQEKHQRTL